MTLNIVVPYGTIFKLWLYKKATNKQTVLNYEVKITNKALSKEVKPVSSQGLRCEHLAELPTSFNTDRYLGNEG